MIEINWGAFKAKFNGKEQATFQWLCYLLFCKEFGQIIGISRYENHAGIETDPIKVDEDWIGWQAKYYETRLSEHKRDFITALDTAKKRHPEITKIIFYLNIDFGQNSKKSEPRYKTEVEQHAEGLGIKVDWRTASFFESPFVCEENSSLTSHFFSTKKSVIDFVNELIFHTASVLEPIRTAIDFNGQTIKIDRSLVLNDLLYGLAKSPVAILSGEAGVGKTAVIKELSSVGGGSASLFVFKANEFSNVSHVNEIFKQYGDFTFSDFLNAHEGLPNFIVIDSAEKISDIDNQEVFQEFVSGLLKSKWRIIFTTRNSYLDDLKFQFVEIYKISFWHINIKNLSTDELKKLSQTYQFELAKNQRLLELIHNPFYLCEYLKSYEPLESSTSYSDFKNMLWNREISKTAYKKHNLHLKRENCFLSIAKKRAAEGGFYVQSDECEDDVLRLLEADEIIKYDSDAGGFFITHDIYEEWALEKLIERAFLQLGNCAEFYSNIGSTLPIRRAFRNWLSEKLFSSQEDINTLIETTISDESIEDYWKDEVIISVLLSWWAQNYFQFFESKLLENRHAILVKVAFLLRIACKEINEDFLKFLGLTMGESASLKTIFTRPKGQGWSAFIAFVNKHKDIIGLEHLSVILPVLDDWNKEYKTGHTTKAASQISLFYYEEMVKNNSFSVDPRDETGKKLIDTILNGSHEIKGELTEIIEAVIKKREVSHRGKYNALVHTILSSVPDSFEVSKNLPDQVLRLADLYWHKQPRKDSGWFGMDASVGPEKYFCLRPYSHEFFPASAMQTPILNLLRFAPQETVEFILAFTNRAVECYSGSELNNEISEIDVFIDESKAAKQYISDRLWNMYRGTQVSTNLLESMHMALEKWLLDLAKESPKETIESWCKYLLEHSHSASISAVVTSVVLANKYKLFDIAKILFQTREFFLFDTRRLVHDQGAISLYSIGYPLHDFMHQLFQDERIKTCKDEHRNVSLEQLAINYQFFAINKDDEIESHKRQNIIWAILDKYYEQLPDKSEETSKDKTWRLYLARMDRRKMKPMTEEKGDQTQIIFNPEIEPELKKFSDESLKKGSESMKYSRLSLWANYRFRGDEEKYKDYGEYDKNVDRVIKETKEIIEILRAGNNDEISLFNRSTPAYTCSILMRDYYGELSDGDKQFCKEVVLDFASLPLRFGGGYFYQVSDGTQPTISILHLLVVHFPEEKEAKAILFALLLNSWSQTSEFALWSVRSLWDISSEDANSIFMGYLHLKPKYEELVDKIRKENYAKEIYETSERDVLDRFDKEYDANIEKMIANTIGIDWEDLHNLESTNMGTLISAFEMLPDKVDDDEHKQFLSSLFPIMAKWLTNEMRAEDFEFRHKFLKKYAYFVLSADVVEIESWLQPFINSFLEIREAADIFDEFIWAEDYLNKYEEFWTVWGAFYKKIVELCAERRKVNRSYRFRDNDSIYSFLLAWSRWKKEARDWHTLKDREKSFYKRVSIDIGYDPAVLYSLSKVLNDIGSNFRDDGIFWISGLLMRNPELFNEELERNTIYYIENLSRGYIVMNRHKVRTNPQIKKKIIVILNFLIERGSVTGYMLREDIL